jgi:small-conductance mechanosensitive channel
MLAAWPLFSSAPSVADGPVQHVPADLTADAVETFVAPLSDSDARRLLIEQLRNETSSSVDDELASASTDSGSPENLFSATFGQLIEQLPLLLGAMHDALTSDRAREAVEHYGTVFRVVAIAVLLAVLVEWLVRRSHHELRQHIHLAPTYRVHKRLGLALLRVLLDAVSWGVFAAISLLTLYWLTSDALALRFLGQQLVIAATLLRGLHIVARFLFAPRAEGLRLLSTSNADAVFLYRASMCIGAFAVLSVLAATVILEWGLSPPLYRVSLAIVGTVIALGLITAVWLLREPVATEIAGGRMEDLQRSHQGRHLLAHSWHLLASAYLLLTGALWASNTIMGRDLAAAAAIWSLLIVLLLPVADKIVHALLDWIVSRHLPAGEDAEEVDQTFIILALLRGVRIVLVVLALVALAEAWGLGVIAAIGTESGRAAMGALFDIFIVVGLAYVGWDLFKHLLRRWVPEEDERPALPSDGEGGSGGATRAQTLLPLLRTFVLAVLMIMVTMLILDELGVNIGPLIAGAGVVGLAIGFGAQKLVQDVISGIFFLIDDAFRRGEYIEVNDLRGTVEKISVRSMQLRHHRGPLQTVPFSEIPYIKNHSRDWIIMKLEFRVPYDTNVERVRKLIKTLGQEMLKDEELGPSFIEPLKSQGVNRMEHSAMVVRMKFTSVPGEQWVLRREVFRRVQERLQEEGIQFARPIVSVQIDGDDTPQSRDRLGAVAAAGGSSVEDSSAVDSR